MISFFLTIMSESNYTNCTTKNYLIKSLVLLDFFIVNVPYYILSFNKKQFIYVKYINLLIMY